LPTKPFKTKAKAAKKQALKKQAVTTTPVVKPATTGTLKTLERIISKCGWGSRREARSWVHAKRFSVNGKITENPDQWVDLDRDEVLFDGRPLTAKSKIYLLLYKPTGYVTTYKDPEGRPTVYDLISGLETFVGTGGRLDLDTSGLLILSNDTDFLEHLTNPISKVPKTYLVKAADLLSDEQIGQLAAGVKLDEGPRRPPIVTKPAIVKRLRDGATKSFIELTITEGRNRQVRRMLEAVGSKVLKLVRTSIGPIEIAPLQIGQWRELLPEELLQLGYRPPQKAKPKASGSFRARRK
jgi:23S rRNA pseudouridine2605 synthase